jgi:hypothetical protein
MTKEQLNNLIYFSFHFHETMDMKVLDCDKDYLIEKWDKYIGVKPKEVNITYEYFLENKTYFHLVIRRWFEKWDKNGESWDELSPIINFINEINLLDPPGKFNNMMTPEKLTTLFDKHIGYLEEINKQEYNSLHSLINKQVVRWLNKPEINREYKLKLILD